MFRVYVFSVSLFLVVSTSAIDCLERLVSKMNYYVSSGTSHQSWSWSLNSQLVGDIVVNWTVACRYVQTCGYLPSTECQCPLAGTKLYWWIMEVKSGKERTTKHRVKECYTGWVVCCRWTTRPNCTMANTILGGSTFHEGTRPAKDKLERHSPEGSMKNGTQLGKGKSRIALECGPVCWRGCGLNQGQGQGDWRSRSRWQRQLCFVESCYMKMHQPGVEPATCRLQLQYPIHYAVPRHPLH